MITDTLGSPETDRFWIEIEKRGGDWTYILRTHSEWASGRGAEVARLNAYHIASQNGEKYLRAFLAKLNSEDPEKRP